MRKRKYYPDNWMPRALRPPTPRKPRTPPTAPLAIAALAWDKRAFSIIAKKLGLSRQHVARVAHGDRQSKAVEKALRMAIARRRYP